MALLVHRPWSDWRWENGRHQGDAGEGSDFHRSQISFCLSERGKLTSVLFIWERLSAPPEPHHCSWLAATGGEPATTKMATGPPASLSRQASQLALFLEQCPPPQMQPRFLRPAQPNSSTLGHSKAPTNKWSPAPPQCAQQLQLTFWPTDLHELENLSPSLSHSQRPTPLVNLTDAKCTTTTTVTSTEFEMFPRQVLSSNCRANAHFLLRAPPSVCPSNQNSL